jgi:hypothetical protein
MCSLVKVWILDPESSGDNRNWVEIAWNEIAENVEIGDTIRFTVSGAHGTFTKARFRINNGEWTETTEKFNGNFYWDYQVSTAGSHTVNAEVFK